MSEDTSTYEIEINYRIRVANNVTNEFNLFYAKEMEKSKDEIFYDYYKINFYNEMKDYLVTDEGNFYLNEKAFKCLYKEGEDVLDSLYTYYLKQEYASVNSWDEIGDLIIRYCEKYHEDIMGGTEIE